MYDDSNALVQSFLHKPITDCTVAEIKTITQRYPYFAPAQLALLKKQKQENDPEYENQLHKAVLYFYDPLQFEAFVNSEKFTTEFDFSLPQEQPETTVQEDEAPKGKTNFSESETAIPEPTPLEIEEEQEASEEITQPAEPPISIPLPNLKEPTATHGFTFEPYHTVDYFASQGIKLTSEEAPKDRFGKQLKSFTEWLKTMKRLPEAELSKNLDSRTERKVENLAQHSLEQAEIYTETMAEVWEKQGNFTKAIEVYNKLSLLNPAKKAYFAAKIDRLRKAP